MTAPTVANTQAAASLAEETAGIVRETALTVCWAQWRSLGALVSARGLPRAHAIVDPEALVLLSLGLRDQERRLDDLLGWWTQAGATLLSVQRAHNLAGRFPRQTTQALGAFARLALEAGDTRWRRYAAREGEGPDEQAVLRLNPRPGKGAPRPALDAPPALLVRLRAGFGVGAKADLLTFLLGIEGQYVTTRQAARATGYTDVAVRTAAQEMARACFVREEADERPARYSVDPMPWAGLLGLAVSPTEDSLDERWPRWRYWAAVFAFFAAVLAWAREGGEAASWSAYVWSARARDLVEAHAQVFKATTVERPSMNGRPGDEYLRVFRSSVRQVCQWAAGHL